MAPEQTDFTVDQKQRETAIRQKRSHIFYGVHWLAFGALTGCGYLTLRYLGALGYQWWRGNPFLLFWFGLRMLWSWANYAGTLACRRLGLSLEGTTRETIARPNELAMDEASTLASFVLNRGCGAYLISVCNTLLSLIFVRSLLLANHHLAQYLTRHPAQLVIQALIFAVTATTAIFTWRNSRQPELRADSSGITLCDTLGFSSRFIEWQRIALVDIQTKHNVFGALVKREVLLRDDRHKKLARILPSSESNANNRANLERFINHLALRFTGQLHYPEAAAEPVAVAPIQTLQRPRKETSDIPVLVKFGPDFVEVKVAWYYRLFLSVGISGLSVMLLRWTEHTESLWERIIVEVVPIAFFLATLVAIPLLHFTAVRMRADGRGFARRVGFFDREQLTLWHCIAGAELEEKRDENIFVLARYLVLKNRDGEVLARVNVTDLMPGQSARLLEFIRKQIILNR